MHKKFLAILFFVSFVATAQAQELLARISVLANKIGTQVDKKVFQTLQAVLINIDKDLGDNVYKATLTIQAARPIFNTTYESPLINYQDDNFTFRYVEFQPIEFNENRVQGSDPVAANLTATLAYYIYIILGMDYDSYSLRGGDAYFQK